MPRKKDTDKKPKTSSPSQKPKPANIESVQESRGSSRNRRSGR